MPVIQFSEYLKEKYGQRVQRIPLHAGMTCPNRDGTVGTGGCIYCDNGSFHHGLDASASISQQMEQGLDQAAKRGKAKKFLAYFQTYSNTYAPVDRLKEIYSQAVGYDDVVGIFIATRPDCLQDDIVELLASFNQKVPVWLELGLQTSHDVTLQLINRGHTRQCSEWAVRNVLEAGLQVAAHAILGLPGETEPMMMETADWLNQLGVQGVKLHHLHAVKGTKLAALLAAGYWQPLEVHEYIELAAQFLNRLPSGTVTMRLVGDCPDVMLLAPKWEMNKSEILRRIWSRYGELHKGDR